MAMKRFAQWVVAGTMGVSLTGCYSFQGVPDYTASGALAGGATGAIIGSMSRNPGAGAAIGGAIGALAGGIIGHGMDQAQEARLKAQSPQTLQRVEKADPLTVLDVKSLVKAGINDELIISQIRNSRTIYRLSTADIIELKNAGASDTVIDFMINTPTQIPAASVAGASGSIPPTPLLEPTPAPPGPDFIWVSGSWIWLGDRWSWRHGYWNRPAHPRRPR
jgi:outer membrane lipoprotein SlyB